MSATHRRIGMAGMALFALLFFGCASTARLQDDRAPILPAAPSRLEIASPASRDALNAGLSWIALDAPTTRVEPSPPPPPTVPTPPKGGAR